MEETVRIFKSPSAESALVFMRPEFNPSLKPKVDFNNSVTGPKEKFESTSVSTLERHALAAH
jgi:hypothetical protein